MTRVSLLPRNKTKFEDAIDLTGARIDELPIDIPKVVRPYEIPTPLLPWLAWSQSVDIWREDWPEEKRRYVTAQSLLWHYKKGTAWLLRRYTELLGGKVKRIITPPATTFLMPAFTAEERAAYLARFAQLRVRPYVERGLRKYSHFTTKAYGRDKAFLNASYVHGTGAWQRWYRQASLWDAGVETVLTTRAVVNEVVGNFDAADYDEVILPAQPSSAIFLGGFNAERRVGKSFLIDDLFVRQRMVRISRAADYVFSLGRETYTTVWPDADFIKVEPQTIYEPHTAQAGSLFPSRRQMFVGAYLPKSIAWRYVYERWHLHDPDRVPDERKRSVHLNYTRLGMPPYHAEPRIRMTGKAHPRHAWRYVFGYLKPADQSTLNDIIYAARASKARRDKMLIDTKTYRKPVPGDRLKVGSHNIGQFIEA